MSDPRTSLVVAEAEAAAARLRLSGTVSDLQSRLDPAVLAQEARQAGLSAVGAGMDSARRNPGVIVAAMGTVGLLLIRNRIATALRRCRARRPVPAAPKSSS